MSYRNILVHIDSSAASRERLRSAICAAQCLQAKVEADYAVTPWLWLHPTAAGDTGLSSHLSSQDLERTQRAKQAVAEILRDLPEIKWTDNPTQSPYDFSERALYSDLLVLGQHSDTDPDRDDVPPDFVPAMMFRSGRPALVIPHGQTLTSAPRTILIAWNASRQSARALTCALPWLHLAKEVHVGIWTQETSQQEESASRLTAYLQCHGFGCQVHARRPLPPDAGQAILQLASSTQADMLVMGCYGHSRAREWLLGGATATVLKEARLPLLMSH